ncbi:MAG: dTMP kinase [Nitrososphaera sp.]
MKQAGISSRPIRYYGKGIPYQQDTEVKGRLVVIEGPDASGRSTHIGMITAKLEADGHAVLNTGLRRSELVSEGIMQAKQEHMLGRRTMSLFYAADFADQLENKIMPALRAGYVVLADRYIYTAFARDSVRGCHPRWVRNMYDFAVRPDISFYFKVPVDVAFDRIVKGRPKLKYYEAGMDMNLSNDPYESYRIFQSRVVEQYESMIGPENFVVVDGTTDIEEQQKAMRRTVMEMLPGFKGLAKEVTV